MTKIGNIQGQTFGARLVLYDPVEGGIWRRVKARCTGCGHEGWFQVRWLRSRMNRNECGAHCKRAA